MSYIDLHAHVLPGVDDGAETLEASLMMLRMASEHGTKALAVTPVSYTHLTLPTILLV